MPKYIGQDYSAKARSSSPIDRVALHKAFQDEHPERNVLLQDIVDRLNLVLANVREVGTKDASDINYEDTEGNRISIGDALESVVTTTVAASTAATAASGWNELTGSSQDRVDHVSAIIGDKIYVAFGGNKIGRTNTIAEYDITNDSWADPVSLGIELYATTSVGYVDSVYFFGGGEYIIIEGVSTFVRNNSLRKYTIATETLSTVSTSGPTARSSCKSVIVDGSIYIIGGADESGNLDELWAYNITLDTWTELTGSSVGFYRGCCAVHNDGMIYVYGGMVSSIVNTASLQSYNISSDTWTALTAAPEAFSFSVMGVISGVLYVYGGRKSSGGGRESYPYKTFMAYTISSDSWKLLADGPHATSPYSYPKQYGPFGLESATANAYNGAIYVFGGYEGPTFYVIGDVVTNLDDGYIDEMWSYGVPSATARTHDIDSTDDHNGVGGATEDNFISFDANGLPKDSSKNATDFDKTLRWRLWIGA